MYPVGLTGGIGSGKSTVAALLAAHGAVVIDADRIAREVVEPGQPALADIVAAFGDGVLRADGTLDREALADIVFADEAARRRLEAITHPRIGERIWQRTAAIEREEAADGRTRILVVDHPLLVETGQADHYPAVVVVVAPEDVRVARLVARGVREPDARARIRSQAGDEQRLAAATHVIDNAGDLDQLRRQVDAVWEELSRAALEAGDSRLAGGPGPR